MLYSQQKSKTTSAKLKEEDVGEGVVASFILMRRQGGSRSKAEKRPEVERGGIQKWSEGGIQNQTQSNWS